MEFMEHTLVSEYGFILAIIASIVFFLVPAGVFFFEKWIANEKVERAIIHPEKWNKYLIKK